MYVHLFASGNQLVKFFFTFQNYKFYVLCMQIKLTLLLNMKSLFRNFMFLVLLYAKGLKLPFMSSTHLNSPLPQLVMQYK